MTVWVLCWTACFLGVYVCRLKQSKSPCVYRYINKVCFFVLFQTIIKIFFFIFLLAAFNDCQTRESCGDCISSSPDCSWCEDIVRFPLMLSHSAIQQTIFVDAIRRMKKMYFELQLTATHPAVTHQYFHVNLNSCEYLKCNHVFKGSRNYRDGINLDPHIKYKFHAPFFMDPRPTEGPIKSPLSVCQYAGLSVRPSVRHFSQEWLICFF